jgi:hypothetical protein
MLKNKKYPFEKAKSDPGLADSIISSNSAIKDKPSIRLDNDEANSILLSEN